MIDPTVEDRIDERADEAYDRERQRQVDEGSDPVSLLSKRSAAGVSVEELFLEQVMTEGMHAGLTGREASENPYQSDTLAHAEWERCRAMAVHCSLAGMVA